MNGKKWRELPPSSAAPAMAMHLAVDQISSLQAMWSRFLPSYVYLREQLDKKAVGDVSVVRATFGLKMDTKPRVYDKKFGGSVLLDIGIYTLTFADVVFNGERPEKIVASGHLFDSGVDHTASVTLLFSGRRIAQLLFTAGLWDTCTRETSHVFSVLQHTRIIKQ